MNADRSAASRPRTRIGVGQMLVEPGKLDANLGRAAEMIRDAAEQGCDVVVLPEYLDLGWTHASAADLARPVPGPTTHVLAEAARANGIYVAAGMTERAGSRRYNAAVLVSPAGQLLLHHRKINEVGPGRAVYATGRRLKVVETELGAIGLAVCADTLPPALAIGRALGLIGASRVVGPTGQVLLRGPYGVGAAALLTVDVRRRRKGTVPRQFYATFVTDVTGEAVFRFTPAPSATYVAGFVR